MTPIISIILPTHNRGHILPFTLNLLKDQIGRNKDKVEFIICDNCSTDNTKEVLSRIAEEENYFTYKYYEEFVDIGVSIARSVENANGKYVLLWGDDDAPSPTLVDTLLIFIEKYPEVACFHFNRLVGVDGNNFTMNNLSVNRRVYTGECTNYSSASDFIAANYHSMGFLSADLFLLSAWRAGSHIDCKKHYGFEFLAPIFWGIKEQQCLYIDFPLCIQRHPRDRKWLSRSPLFRYIGMPNLLKDLESMGIINEWYTIWNTTSNTRSTYISVIPQMTLDKKMYFPLIKEMNSYQTSLWRKLYALVVLYLLPKRLYEFARNQRFKK